MDPEPWKSRSQLGLDGSPPIARQKSSSWVWEMKKGLFLLASLFVLWETSVLVQLLGFFIQSLFWMELLTTVVCQTLAAV